MVTTVNPEKKPVYGADKAGCWFDCCRGIYIGEAIIQTAVRHGFDDSDVYLEGRTRYADLDCYHELTGDAETFMQQFATDGFWFGYTENGDWGLWAIEDED